MILPGKRTMARRAIPQFERKIFEKAHDKDLNYSIWLFQKFSSQIEAPASRVVRLLSLFILPLAILHILFKVCSK